MLPPGQRLLERANYQGRPGFATSLNPVYQTPWSSTNLLGYELGAAIMYATSNFPIQLFLFPANYFSVWICSVAGYGCGTAMIPLIFLVAILMLVALDVIMHILFITRNPGIAPMWSVPKQLERYFTDGFANVKNITLPFVAGDENVLRIHRLKGVQALLCCVCFVGGCLYCAVTCCVGCGVSVLTYAVPNDCASQVPESGEELSGMVRTSSSQSYAPSVITQLLPPPAHFTLFFFFFFTSNTRVK